MHAYSSAICVNGSYCWTSNHEATVRMSSSCRPSEWKKRDRRIISTICCCDTTGHSLPPLRGPACECVSV